MSLDKNYTNSAKLKQNKFNEGVSLIHEHFNARLKLVTDLLLESGMPKAKIVKSIQNKYPEYVGYNISRQGVYLQFPLGGKS